MSLISLLIALGAERHLSSPIWQFNFYYQHYLRLFNRISWINSSKSSASDNDGETATSSVIANTLFIAIPVVACYLIIEALDNSLLYLIVSTLVLIVCFGCIQTRNCYKQYLLAAFRGEPTTCELHHLQLLQDKNLMDMGFGQSLVWLNYRYFIAIMIFFVLFGAPGALAYRLLTKITEQNNTAVESDDIGSDLNKDVAADIQRSELPHAHNQAISVFSQKILFWLDWLPVRAVAFCYMLVGHFSKAMPVWLDDVFNIEKLPHVLLVDVAEASEDFMIEQGDCTAEPCLLVRLAKRTLLLCLAVIALLILTGVLS
ncbi:regulatory signaling modulator protein AmpE [Thalassotalea piscium]|uniref:AmpE protein n=1 Tax=Thalassotalea piscium TaxID=1230533 RepID=A0A7X0NE78_9GAMM|nr:regulatory signaling modulator protein AmpE [Thalassotalea piscium]MBB6541775.1 AmpE protein [Thalassotalea piscium]